MVTDTRFPVLCAITRAQHFAWRQAVAEAAPGIDAGAVVDRMWEVTGRQTAASYLRRIDRSRPIAPQVAAAIVWSSRCMGEDAVEETEAATGRAVVRHTACPWLSWHARQGLLEEDLRGCDVWFAAIAREVGAALGADLRVKTEEALPRGDCCCRRVLWVEEGRVDEP